MPPCSTRIVTPQSRFPPRKPFTRMQALAKSKTITARWLELPLESVQKPFHEPQSGQVITVSFRCNPRGRVGVVHHHEHGAVLPSPPLHFPLPRQQSPLFLQKALQPGKMSLFCAVEGKRQERGCKTKSFVMTTSLRYDTIEK